LSKYHQPRNDNLLNKKSDEVSSLAVKRFAKTHSKQVLTHRPERARAAHLLSLLC